MSSKEELEQLYQLVEKLAQDLIGESNLKLLDATNNPKNPKNVQTIFLPPAKISSSKLSDT